MKKIPTRCPKCGHQMKQEMIFTIESVVKGTGRFICINCGYIVNMKEQNKKTRPAKKVSDIGDVSC